MGASFLDTDLYYVLVYKLNFIPFLSVSKLALLNYLYSIITRLMRLLDGIRRFRIFFGCVEHTKEMPYSFKKMATEGNIISVT